MPVGALRQLSVGGAAVFGERLDEWPVGVLQRDRSVVRSTSWPVPARGAGRSPAGERSFEPGGGRRPGREQVEQAVGLEGDDLTADRELAEQQRGSLFAIAGVNRAEDLGSPRGQLHPRGVRDAPPVWWRRSVPTPGHSGCGRPVGPAEPLGIELADDPTTRASNSRR